MGIAAWTMSIKTARPPGRIWLILKAYRTKNEQRLGLRLLLVKKF